MSASHPSEAEGRTPVLTSPEYEFGAALMHYEEMVQKHPNGGEEFGKARRRVLDLFRLATRSPRDEPDSVGALISSLEDHIAREDMPNIRRTLTALKYAHQKDLRRAAPSVEARDADREAIAQTLWIGFGLHVEKLGFHSDPESALRAASLIVQYARAATPEKT